MRFGWSRRCPGRLPGGSGAAGEAQEQLHGAAVCGHGVQTGLTLADQPVSEEPLEQRASSPCSDDTETRMSGRLGKLRALSSRGACLCLAVWEAVLDQFMAGGSGAVSCPRPKARRQPRACRHSPSREPPRTVITHKPIARIRRWLTGQGRAPIAAESDVPSVGAPLTERLNWPRGRAADDPHLSRGRDWDGVRGSLPAGSGPAL